MSQIVSVDLIAAAKLSADVPREYTDEGLKTAAGRYKKFLMLAVKNKDAHLVPTKEIDMMWHLHMLHPRAYYNDCMELFGDILDHNGGYGLHPEETEGHAAASKATTELWENEFGESYLHDLASCRADKATGLASCRADKATDLASCRADKATDVASCMSDYAAYAPRKQLVSCGSETMCRSGSAPA